MTLLPAAESIQASLYEPTPRRWGRALVAAAVLAVIAVVGVRHG